MKAPRNDFGFYDPPVEGPTITELFLHSFHWVILAVILFLFLHFVFFKKQRTQSYPSLCKFEIDLFKYLSIFSILFGILGTTIQIQSVLEHVGIAGVADLGYIAGPLSEALKHFIFGLVNAVIGISCFSFLKWRFVRSLDTLKSSD